MKTKFIVLTVSILTACVGKLTANTNPVSEGKTIFTSRCAACHNVNKTITGPALAGIDERRSTEWIINFVRSSQTLIKNGDKDAIALYEKFNKIPMPDHPDLTDENIKSIVEFIKSESKPVAEETAPFSRPSKRKPNYTPLSITNDWEYFAIYTGTVLLLIGALIFAVQVGVLKEDRPS